MSIYDRIHVWSIYRIHHLSIIIFPLLFIHYLSKFIYRIHLWSIYDRKASLRKKTPTHKSHTTDVVQTRGSIAITNSILKG